MLPALLVLLAVVSVYMQALGGPFLWDDRPLILGAPLVENGAGLGEYLRHPFWMHAGGLEPSSLAYYRPLVTLSFALDHRLHGSNPGGYHLTNLVLHVTAAWLLLALLLRARTRPATATLLTVAWALLPRLAEAAAWISGRTDLFAAVFTFAALLVWGPELWRRLLAAAFLFAGLLSKEVALAVLPALCLAEWVAARPAGPGERARRIAAQVAPLIVAVAAYGVLRWFTAGYRDEGTPLGIGERVLIVLQAVGTYAGMLLDPFRPRAVIGRTGVLSWPAIAGGVVCLIAGAVGLVRFRRRLGRASVLGLGLAAFALLPVLHLVPIPLRTFAADRFLYLPTAGLVLAVAPGLDAWLRTARARWALCVAVTLALGVVAFRRVSVWSDELEFWVTTYLQTPPINSAPVTELFGVYYRAGLFNDALAITGRSANYDDPRKRDDLYNSAICLARLGRRKEAEARFQASHAPGRYAPDAERMLAILALEDGAFAEGRARLERLAHKGDKESRAILKLAPGLEFAQTELAHLAEGGDPERRAELATFLADDARATPAWMEVAQSGHASRAALSAGLKYLVQTGHRRAIEVVAREYEARFGPLGPEVAAMVQVHLAELERLIAARARLGLPPPPPSNFD